MTFRSCILITLITSVSFAKAQDADVSFLPGDSTLTSSDSLNIFSLIDSLLALQEAQGSQLAVRLSYNSNVLSAGRSLGIENFGLSPSVSYFHKSGFYADASAFWSKDFEPSYYLTILSAGYMKDIGKHFSVMAGYDRYFYNLDNDAYIPYRNTLSVTPIVDVKPFSLSVNYSFYFGDEYAHRIMPGLSGTIEKRKWWKLDRIALSPAVYALWGNSLYTTIETIPPATIREAIDNFRKYGTRYRTEMTDHEVFGIMNYAISVPLFISYKKWSFNFSYIYNIPKALPGEPDALSQSTYLSGSIMYIINLTSLK